MHICYKFRKYKKKIITSFLNAQGINDIKFTWFSFRAKSLAKKYNATVVQWASKQNHEVNRFCKENNLPLLFVEDGFIRSKGLGAFHNIPSSLVFDNLGIYYNPKGSRLFEILKSIKKRDDHDALVLRAQKLKEILINSKVSKYNLSSDLEINEIETLKKSLPKDKKIILVPGQVEDDASVLTGGMGIKSNLELLKEVRSHNEDAFIIFKPHPDVVYGKREDISKASTNAKSTYNAIIYHSNILKIFNLVDEIHTLTSLSGFEALIRNKKVCVYGKPFYAGWGLTHDYHHFKDRDILLSLDELIAGALILYPLYINWDTNKLCEVEDVVKHLENH